MIRSLRAPGGRFAFTCLLLGLALAADPAAAQHKWKGQNLFGPNTSVYKDFQAFAARVKEATNGALEIQAFPVATIVPQAEALDAIMTGRGPLVVVDIAVPEAVLVRRLLSRRVCSECGANARPDDELSVLCARCGGRLVQRSDDKESVVRERLATYWHQTRPLVEYYQAAGTLVTLHAERSIDEVHAEISSALALMGEST